MSASRKGRRIFSGSRRADGKRSVCLFPHVVQYLTYNIFLWCRALAGRWRARRRQAGERGGVCVACFVCAFSFVACMSSCAAENAAGSCKCTAHTMCLNSHHRIYAIYAVRFGIFHRWLFISASYTEALFLEKGWEKGRRAEGRGREREREPLASKFHRSRATIVTYYLTTPMRVARGNKRSYIL